MTSRKITVHNFVTPAASDLRPQLLQTLAAYGIVESVEVNGRDVTVQYQRLSSAEDLACDALASKLPTTCSAPNDTLTSKVLFVFGRTLPRIMTEIRQQAKRVDPTATLHVKQGSNYVRDVEEELRIWLHPYLSSSSETFFGFLQTSSIAKSVEILTQFQKVWCGSEVACCVMFVDKVERVCGKCDNMLSMLRETDLRVGLETPGFLTPSALTVDIGFYRLGGGQQLVAECVRLKGGKVGSAVARVMVRVTEISPELLGDVTSSHVAIPLISATTTVVTIAAPQQTSIATLQSIIRAKLKGGPEVVLPPTSLFSLNQIVERCTVRSYGVNDMEVTLPGGGAPLTCRVHRGDIALRVGSSIPWNKAFLIGEDVTIRIVCRVNETEYLGSVDLCPIPVVNGPPSTGVVIGANVSQRCFYIDVGTGHATAQPATMSFQSVSDIFPNLEDLGTVITLGMWVFVEVLEKRGEVVTAVGFTSIAQAMVARPLGVVPQEIAHPKPKPKVMAKRVREEI